MLFSALWLLVVVDLTGRLLYKLTISVDRCFAESGIGLLCLDILTLLLAMSSRNAGGKGAFV